MPSKHTTNDYSEAELKRRFEKHGSWTKVGESYGVSGTAVRIHARRYPALQSLGTKASLSAARKASSSKAAATNGGKKERAARQTMIDAAAAVQGGMSVQDAAEKFGVSVTGLRNRLHKKLPGTAVVVASPKRSQVAKAKVNGTHADKKKNGAQLSFADLGITLPVSRDVHAMRRVEEITVYIGQCAVHGVPPREEYVAEALQEVQGVQQSLLAKEGAFE